MNHTLYQFGIAFLFTLELDILNKYRLIVVNNPSKYAVNCTDDSIDSIFSTIKIYKDLLNLICI